MKLQIRVDDQGNIIDSCFKTFGCGSAIASSSVATEWVKGKNVDEVRAQPPPRGSQTPLRGNHPPATACRPVALRSML